MDEAAIHLRLTALAKRGAIASLAHDDNAARSFAESFGNWWVPFKPLHNHKDFFPSQTDDSSTKHKPIWVKKLPILEYSSKLHSLSAAPKGLQNYFINLCHRHVRLANVEERLMVIQSLSAFLVRHPFQPVFDQVVVTDIISFLEPLLYLFPLVPNQADGARL